MKINKVWCLVEDETFMLARAVALMAPDSLVQEADKVLTEGMLINSGDLVRFIELNGFNDKRLIEPLGSEGISALVEELIPNTEHAIVRLGTDARHYNVIAIFGND